MEKSRLSGCSDERFVKPHVNYLVLRRFPNAHNERVRRNVQRLHGNYEDSRLWLEITRYEAHLDSLSQEELDNLAIVEKQKEEKERYFNQPGAMADYVHWSQCARWTLDEAVALTLAREPRVVGINGVNAHAAASSPFAKEYLRRTDLVKRAREAGELFEPALPGLFLTWAKLRELEYPKELEEALEARGHTFADMKKIVDDLKAAMDQVMEQNARLAQQNKRLLQERDDLIEQGKCDRQAEKPLHPREKQSMLKMIYGMAVAYHGYDPDSSRSDTVKSIRDELGRIGINISDGTILKYLREGAEECPPMDGAPSG